MLVKLGLIGKVSCMIKFADKYLCLLIIGLLAACSSNPEKQPIIDVSSIPDPVPRQEPLSRTGNPSTYQVFGKQYQVMASSEGYRQHGHASWYGDAFHGKSTSSGQPFNMYEVSAAHRHLPIPTYVRVTRLDNGKSIVVRVNDRGPFVDGRIIDLSYAAAAKLDMVELGTAPVEVVALAPYQYLSGAQRDYGRQQRIVQPQQKPPAPRHNPVATSPNELPVHQPVLALISETQPRFNYATMPVAPAYSPVYLQVGAFSERRYAEALRAQLARSLGQPILVASHDSLYKVRIGPMSNNAELAAVTLQLVDLDLKPSRVFLQ